MSVPPVRRSPKRSPSPNWSTPAVTVPPVTAQSGDKVDKLLEPLYQSAEQSLREWSTEISLLRRKYEQEKRVNENVRVLSEFVRRALTVLFVESATGFDYKKLTKGAAALLATWEDAVYQAGLSDRFNEKERMILLILELESLEKTVRNPRAKKAIRYVRSVITVKTLGDGEGVSIRVSGLPGLLGALEDWATGMSKEIKRFMDAELTLSSSYLSNFDMTKSFISVLENVVTGRIRAPAPKKTGGGNRGNRPRSSGRTRRTGKRDVKNSEKSGSDKDADQGEKE